MVNLWRQRNTERNNKMKKYDLTVKEYLAGSIVILIVLYVVSDIFFKSYIPFILLLIPWKKYMKYVDKMISDKRRQKLLVQFKDFCLSLSAQLSAGYSLENSLTEVYREMTQIYGKKSDICIEIKQIILKVNLNVVIEDCFSDFAARTGIEEIKLFADVISISKRSGGDMIKIVKMAADNISKKIEVDREIKTIINSKKNEQMIMNFVPFIIIFYVRTTSPEMMDVMYKTLMGRVIMFLCLLVYVITLWWGNKLTSIEI